MIQASACGKIILFGEHAVVYGRPALAVPLSQLRARVTVTPRADKGIVIRALDLNRVIRVGTDSDALGTIAQLTLAHLGATADLELAVSSAIPPAGGLGSGAAVSTAIVRALGAFFERQLSAAEVSSLVYETEKVYHGTPSGIDNTVIAYEQPVRYVRGQEMAQFQIAEPFTLLIAHTGVPSPTRITVGDVRRGWEQEPAKYETIFDAVAAIVERAQAALARGENEQLGALMSENQHALEAMGVSSLEIERLVETGLRAGARGGKLSGGGRGGNVIFHVTGETSAAVRAALMQAGAVSVLETIVR